MGQMFSEIKCITWIWFIKCICYGKMACLNYFLMIAQHFVPKTLCPRVRIIPGTLCPGTLCPRVHFVPGHFVPGYTLSPGTLCPRVHFVPGYRLSQVHFVPGHFVPGYTLSPNTLCPSTHFFSFVFYPSFSLIISFSLSSYCSCMFFSHSFLLSLFISLTHKTFSSYLPNFLFLFLVLSLFPHIYFYHFLSLSLSLP